MSETETKIKRVNTIHETMAQEARALEDRAQAAHEAGDVMTYLALRKATLALESAAYRWLDDVYGHDKMTEYVEKSKP